MIPSVVLLVGLAGCAMAAPPHYVRIGDHTKVGMWGGKTTTIDKYPYVASIVFLEFTQCAASIISDSWVLTTESCIHFFTKDDYTVVVGSNDGVTGTSYKVSEIVKHPKFDCDKNYLDWSYALLKIDGKFKFSKKVRTVKLPSKKIQANTELQVVGYGMGIPFLPSSTPNDRLQAGTMKWQPVSSCKKTVAQAFPKANYTTRMACAYNRGKTTLCSYDWGDALVKDGVMYAMYLTEPLDTNFCTKFAAPGIFADVFPVVSWIKSVTGAKLDSEP